MQCPLCGYMMSAFDKECPRCQGKGIPNVNRSADTQPQNTTPIPRQSSLPVAAVEPASPTTALSRKKRTFGVLAAFLAFSFAGYYYWTQTPQYSLWQAKKAFDAHDVQTFEQYVDVDAVVENYFDDAMAESSKQMAGDSAFNTWPEGQQFVKGLTAMMKPALIGFCTKQIRDYIKKGEDEQETTSAPNDLAKLYTQTLKNKIKEQKISYQDIDYVERTGNVASVGLRFTTGAEATNSLTIELQMRRLNGHWQVNRWNNALFALKKVGLNNDTSASPSTRQTATPTPAANANSQNPFTPDTEGVQRTQPNTDARMSAEEAIWFNAFEQANGRLSVVTSNTAEPSLAAANANMEALEKIQNDLRQYSVPRRFITLDSSFQFALSEAITGFRLQREAFLTGNRSLFKEAAGHMEKSATYFDNAQAIAQKMAADMKQGRF